MGLFIFIFCCVSIARVVILTYFTLVNDPNPSKIIMRRNELIFYGLALSYIITYVVK